MGEVSGQRQRGRGFSGGLTARIVKALGIFTGVKSAGMVCSVIRAKLIALWIGPMGVGLNALLTYALDLITQLTQAGLAVSAVRSIAAEPPGERRHQMVSTVLRWAVWLGIIGGLLTLVTSPLLSYFTFGDYGHSYMFVILALAVVAMNICAGPQSALQGLDMLRSLARLSVLSVVISTVVSIPLFYYQRINSIVYVVTLFAVVQCVVFITGFRRQRAEVGSACPPLDRRGYFRMGLPIVRLGLALTLSNILTMAAGYLVTLFLNRYASTAEVGIYQAGYAIVNNYLGIVVSALTMEYFPRLSANIGQLRRSEVLVSHQLGVVAMLMLPGVILFMLLRKPVVLMLYSPDFLDTVPYLGWAIGGGMLRMISVCLALCMLAKADSRAYMVTEVCSSATGIALAVVGNIYGGISGMGMAYTVWYALYTIAVWLVYRFRYGMRIRGRAALRIAVSLAGAAAAVLFI